MAIAYEPRPAPNRTYWKILHNIPEVGLDSSVVEADEIEITDRGDLLAIKKGVEGLTRATTNTPVLGISTGRWMYFFRCDATGSPTNLF